MTPILPEENKQITVAMAASMTKDLVQIGLISKDFSGQVELILNQVLQRYHLEMMVYVKSEIANLVANGKIATDDDINYLNQKINGLVNHLANQTTDQFENKV
jgi:hypothetical protein